MTLAAASFVQIPLQYLVVQAIGSIWSQEYVIGRMLLFGIPQILLGGLAQEGAKMVPLVWYWRREGRSLDLKLGLAVGATAGSAFGIFEARWVHNTIFASVNIWEVMQVSGPLALAGFWERFFVVAAHTALSALVGYGLARGKGWQFYFIASGLHALLNYSAVLLAVGVLTMVQLELYISIFAVSLIGWALWLRWRKISASVQVEASPVQI